MSNNPENKQLSEFYEKFTLAAMRVHNAECSGVPYTETAEYKRLERILIETNRSKYKERKKT